MGFFNKAPEEIAVRDARKHEEAEQREAANREEEENRREKKFAKTPAGQAKAARAARARIFQLSLPLSETTGFTIALTGAYSTTTTQQHASILDSIEAEGWKLEHAGYVYRITGGVSRDKFFASGQQEAVNGEIVGVYIFRAIDI